MHGCHDPHCCIVRRYGRHRGGRVHARGGTQARFSFFEFDFDPYRL